MTKNLHFLIKTTLFIILLISFSIQLPAQIKVACIGNSITAGSGLSNPSVDAWPAVLQRLLGSGYNVKNFGKSGRTMLRKGDYPYWNTTEYTSAKSFNPDIVIIKLGTNDSKAINQPYLIQFETDMANMVDTFRLLPSKPKVYLCIPTPVFGAGIYGITDAVIVNQITPRIQNVATSKNTGLINLRPVLINHPEMVPDLVHPNAAGAALIANQVSATLLSAGVSTPVSNLSIRAFQYKKSLILESNAGNSGIVRLSICNTAGAIVKSFTEEADALKTRKEYLLSALPKGVYLAKIEENGQVKTVKIRIQ